MFGLALGTWLKLGAAVAVLGLLAWSHNAAYQAGRAAEREAVLARSIEILRERNDTDDEVSDMDDADLCSALGGVFTDGTCQ